MKKILIVFRFSCNNITIIPAMLKKAGYDIVTACTGIEAFQYIYHNKIDLIILDTNLHDIDSMDVLKIIVCDKRSKHIPVIITSDSTESCNWLLAKYYGASDYINTPVKNTVLLKKISKIFKSEQEKYNLLAVKNNSPESIIKIPV